MNNNNPSMTPQALAFTAQSSTQPRVAYFISRTNGLLVPLVAVDELPYNVRLQDVPRTLRQDQTFGMQHVATLPLTGATFNLENENSTIRSLNQPMSVGHNRTRSGSPTTPFRAPDVLARQAMANASTSSSIGNEISRHPLPPRPMSAHELATQQWRRPQVPTTTEQSQAVIDAIIAANEGANSVTTNIPPPPSGHIPDQEKKKYCTYWIRTGECDYMQQGCLYLHEMPDADILRSIGFPRGTPRWWMEKNQKVRMGGIKTALVRERETSPAPLTRSVGFPNLRNSVVPTSRVSDDDSDGSGIQHLSGAATPASRRAHPASSPLSTLSVSSQATHLSEIDDLIDLDDSKVVTLSPSTSPDTAPARTVKAQHEYVMVRRPTPKALKAKTKLDVKDGSPTKIFVPAGESAETHIAQARKRANRTSTAPSVKLIATELPAFPKQIQTLEKSTPTGLRASKHAPADTSNAERKVSGPLGRKRVPTRASNEKSTGSREAVIVNLPGGNASS